MDGSNKRRCTRSLQSTRPAQLYAPEHTKSAHITTTRSLVQIIYLVGSIFLPADDLKSRSQASLTISRNHMLFAISLQLEQIAGATTMPPHYPLHLWVGEVLVH
jgi:hypothetical protein